MSIKGRVRQFFLRIKGRFNNKPVFAWRNLPANFHSQDTSSEVLQKDSEYAYKIGHGYLAALLKAGMSPKGLRAIEFGPGHNFGAALYLACHGVKMAVADRFLSPWQSDYHPLFYKEFSLFLARMEPKLCLEPIEKVLGSWGYPVEVDLAPEN